MQIDLNYSSIGTSEAEPEKSTISAKSNLVADDSVENNSIDTGQLACLTLFDGRRRIEYFGQLFPREQMLSWLKSAVDYRFNMNAVPSLKKSAAVPAMVLKKAYISSVGTSMTAVVVLVLRQGEGKTVYRGSKTRLNWNGTDREFSRILSEALDDALSTVSFDNNLSWNCS